MPGFYVLEPEVAGGFGENTILTRTPGKSMLVHKLHYQFDGWLGDPLWRRPLAISFLNRWLKGLSGRTSPV